MDWECIDQILPNIRTGRMAGIFACIPTCNHACMIFRVLMLVGLRRFLGVGFGLGGIKSVLEWDPLVFSAVNCLINYSLGHVCFFGRIRAPAFHIFDQSEYTARQRCIVIGRLSRLCFTFRQWILDRVKLPNLKTTFTQIVYF